MLLTHTLHTHTPTHVRCLLWCTIQWACLLAILGLVMMDDHAVPLIDLFNQSGN